MSQTADYHAAIRHLLEDEYRVDDLTIARADGRHPRARFTYAGKRFNVTLHNSVQGNTNFTDIKRQDIRRLLGDPPPPAEPKPRRKLENMMPSSIQLTPTPQDLRSVAPAASLFGRMSVYGASSSGSRKVSIALPPALATDWLGVGIKLERVADRTWFLRRDPASKVRILDQNATRPGHRLSLRVLTVSGLFAGLPAFGATEVVVAPTANWLEVTLPATLAPLVRRSRRKRLTGVTPVDAGTLEPGTSVTGNGIAPGTVIVEPPPETAPTRAEIEACLAEVRRIERLTDHRLARAKETGAWIFVSRIE